MVLIEIAIQTSDVLQDEQKTLRGSTIFMEQLIKDVATPNFANYDDMTEFEATSFKQEPTELCLSSS